MGKRDKELERLRGLPKDYSFSEAVTLMRHLGFEVDNKGKTSGSRVRFIRLSDGRKIVLHKPHPQDTMKPYMVKMLKDFLSELGEL